MRVRRRGLPRSTGAKATGYADEGSRGGRGINARGAKEKWKSGQNFNTVEEEEVVVVVVDKEKEQQSGCALRCDTWTRCAKSRLQLEIWIQSRRDPRAGVDPVRFSSLAPRGIER